MNITKVSVVIVVFSFFLGGCSSSKLLRVEDPFAELQNMANQINKQGGVASVGMGTSTRMDFAKDKATTDAQGGMSESFETKVSRLKQSFLEEVGSNDSEINETFSTVTKAVSKQTLTGARVLKTIYNKDKKTGKYMAGVLLSIDPKTINQSLLDEMSKEQKLYQRFRSSQAFDELQKEMDNYEEPKE